jgi:hypothetical protein
MQNSHALGFSVLLRCSLLRRAGWPISRRRNGGIRMGKGHVRELPAERMRIDKTQRPWFVASLAILVVATAVYIPYARISPHGPSGASALGLTFGIVGSAFMLFAGLLAARKKVPVWRVGRAQTWMRGHLWLGLLSLPLILFHGAFRFGGPLTTALMILLIIVVGSGLFGAALQHYMPTVMTVEVPLETIFEQIDHRRGQLLTEADDFVEGASTLEGQLASAAAHAAAATEETGVATEVNVTPLRTFYVREMRPFLEKPGVRGHKLSNPAKARAMFEGLRMLLPVEIHETLQDLADICEEERQLSQQLRLHHVLHGWLMLHIPLSLALLLLGAAHAVMALRY